MNTDIDIDIDYVTKTIDDHISKITRIINKKKNCLIDLNYLNNKIKEIELLNNNEEISQIKKELEDKEKSLNNKIQLLQIKKEELHTLQENKKVQEKVFSTTLAESQEEKKEEIKKIILKIQNIIEPNNEIKNIFLNTKQILEEFNTINLKSIEEIINQEITQIDTIIEDTKIVNKDFFCNEINKDMEEAKKELDEKLDERNRLFDEISNYNKNRSIVTPKKSYTEANEISIKTQNIIDIYSDKYKTYYNCKIIYETRQLFKEILNLCHE